MDRTLGPRNLGAILSETFAIYGKNSPRLVAIVAIVEVPVTIVSFVVKLLPAYAEIGTEVMSVSIFVITILVSLVSFVAGILMQGAMIHAISEQHFNHPVDIGRAFRFAWQRLAVMLGAELLVFLAIAGVFLIIIGIPFGIHFAAHGGIGWRTTMAIAIMLIVIGTPAVIYLVVKWLFALQAALLEGCGPKAALSHSSRLVEKNWWRVFGIMLLLLLMAMIVIGILFILLGIGAGIWSIIGATTGAAMETIIVMTVIATIGVTILAILFSPITITAATLLYYDLRVKKEGYSLDALANELGLASTPTDALASPPE
ncbi:MAG: hypothetical protein A2Z75_00345 [Chloroflexi bacterium RBG_13_50_10]|nr:MAG: hypothetical protein A2Z75_00345 [Chloroflexi bacterium RBG_13_50_10]